MSSDNQNILIRHARESDLPFLVPIWEELMAFHNENSQDFELHPDATERWTQQARAALHNQTSVLLVAEYELEVVGFCLGWITRNAVIYAEEEVGYISELVVNPSARRKGLGHALLDKTTLFFRERGLKTLQLSTAIWNKDARALWESAGGKAVLMRYFLPI
ncbi:GNAT family N-acetyltransferase [Myxococcota bacterium]|nr:GNAT family N-acetyltransferase [Myxococcota bacterium]